MDFGVTLAATTAGTTGVPLVVGLLALSEAAVPIPFPTDLLVLALGERAHAGDVTLVVAVVAVELAIIAGTAGLYFVCRRPGRALVTRLARRFGLTDDRIDRMTARIERRGGGALTIGRATPGLRTLTVVAASTSGMSSRRAVVFLVLGSTVFIQLHLIGGYVVGSAARSAIERSTVVVVAVLVVLAVVGLAVWLVRRGRRRGAANWLEASCPLCLAVGLAAGPDTERTDASAVS